jgi:hypothetical protein
MANFEIKITGSGTKNQIEIALLQVIQNLQFTEEKDLAKEIEEKGEITLEDAILITEIKD